MVQGLFIPADSERPLEVRNFDSLDDYQAAVGGWIEAVDVPPLGASLYVNEEGLLRQLPFNSRATFLWWYELPHVRQHAMLVGDALMVGLPGLDGDSTDIPSSTLALLTAKESYAVLVLVEGSPLWVRHPFPYEDYFEAVVWAMVLSERVTGTIDVKVVTEDKVDDLIRQELSRESEPDGPDR